jgi:mycoredoxin
VSYNRWVIRASSIVLGLCVALGVVGLVVGTSSPADAAQPNLSSLTSGGVTIYGAKWCSACRSLEAGLKDRNIAFEVIDVDDNPAAFAKARASANAGGAIPLSSVTTSSKTTWVVGANVEAIDRALHE